MNLFSMEYIYKIYFNYYIDKKKILWNDIWWKNKLGMFNLNVCFI